METSASAKEPQLKDMRCLLECMRYNIGALEFNRFLQFSSLYNQCVEDSSPLSDHHLAKYLKFLIDTSVWPIPAKQLNRIMQIQDQLLEESIIKKSNFVLREAFDLGLKNYYSHVSSTVSGILKNRGYVVKENSDLVRQKEQLVRTKKDMVRARLSSVGSLSPTATSNERTPLASRTQSPGKLPSVSLSHYRSSSRLQSVMIPSKGKALKRKMKGFKKRKQANEPGNPIDAYFKPSTKRLLQSAVYTLNTKPKEAKLATSRPVRG